MIKKIFLVIVFFSQMCLGQKTIVPDSILKKHVDSLVYVVADLWYTDIDAAETEANYMLSYSNEHNFSRGQGMAYAALANVYGVRGDEGMSIAYFIKAADVFESRGNEILLSITDYNIGAALIDQNQYEEAKVYIEKALEFSTRMNRDKNSVTSYSALGAIYIETNKSLDTIIKTLKKGEGLALKLKDTANLASVLNLQGQAYIRNNESFPLAISHIEKSIRLMKIKDPDDHFHLGFSYFLLGKVYWKMGEYNKALRYNDSSLTEYNEFKYIKGIKLAYGNRKDILASQDKYKESFKAFEVYNKLKDSLFHKLRINQTIRMKTEFETDQIIAQKETAETKAKLAEAQSIQNKTYFISSGIIALLAFIASIFYFARLKAKKKAELVTVELRETQKRLAVEKQYRDSELKALKAQMNPHFIFNALNSIQEYIILNQKNLAGDYLGKFADLMRMYLHHSDAGFITVEEEVESLHMYLELEALRFEDTFRYSIDIEKAFKNMTIKIPTMLIQPYIENALKHGLLHRLENRKLQVSFAQKDDNTIVCIIKDNGVGRKKAEEIKAQSNALHKSFATKATENRLQLLNFGKDKKIGVMIEDLLHDDLTAAGTKVTLNIPTLKN